MVKVGSGACHHNITRQGHLSPALSGLCGFTEPNIGRPGYSNLHHVAGCQLDLVTLSSPFLPHVSSCERH